MECAPLFGVARISEITRLDVLGIPVVSVIRRDPIGESVSVCTGKGRSVQEARVTALAEALERYCAEPRGRVPITRASEEELPESRVSPASLVGSLDYPIDRGDVLDWCAGERLDGTRVWVPVNAVMFPYEPSPQANRLFAAHTHGLAAGATRDAATAHGLLECIERDCYSRALALASTGQGDTIPIVAPSAEALVGELGAVRAAGLRYLLRDITSDSGIPCVLCTISDEALTHMGMAAHPSMVVAVRRAVIEAIQSRATDLQGAREDLEPRGGRVDTWFTSAGSAAIVEVRGAESNGDEEGVVANVTAALAAIGLEAVLVDLSLAGVDISVVRVIVPGLEVWAFDPTRIGTRARRWLHQV